MRLLQYKIAWIHQLWLCDSIAACVMTSEFYEDAQQSIQPVCETSLGIMLHGNTNVSIRVPNQQEKRLVDVPSSMK